MARGMKFEAEQFQSRGNFLNLNEELITNVIAKSDGRSEERYDRHKKLRAKYLNEIPGYVPTNPIYRAELDRYLDHLVELRVEAGQVGRDSGFIAPFSVIRDSLKSFASKDLYFHPIKTSLRLLGGYTDAHSECELARMRMMQTFYGKCSDYIKLSNGLYVEEKRDSLNFLETEMQRAYVSLNRYEHFAYGNGQAGLHHDVTGHIKDMEKSWMGESSRLEGAELRRLSGVLGDKGELLLLPPLHFLKGGVRYIKGSFRDIRGWWNNADNA